ncbi:DUF6509 family protein [Sporosarcina sp. G11-34]|uniref:DUF6509 family protein n=1 Tax=Sporosarcina sp. G11-34 TaxID=2849605 RepID=UPI0022A8F16F|nr:DUF6509 family protein [Sporosarcina sp. G11-34]MCZ2258020.1 pullulanase [Sporosarcina sp. G11-34]
MEINEFTVNKMNDPTGILAGERYEYKLYITLDEDDELYSEAGIGIRAIFAVDDNEVGRIVTYHFFERATEKALDFGLEEEEENQILEFCQTHLED